MKRIGFLSLMLLSVWVEARPSDPLYHVNVHGRGSHNDKAECIRLAKVNYDENYLAELKACVEKNGRLQRTESKSWQEQQNVGWKCYFWTLQRCIPFVKNKK